MGDYLIGVPEVAHMLGISTEMVRRKTRRGELPGKKHGGKTSPYKYSHARIAAIVGSH